MAKSVHHQKKRVTHLGKLSNSNLKSDTGPDSGKLWSDCIDYVHNIMQEMDSDIQSVGCYKPNQLSQEKKLNLKSSEVQNTKVSSSGDLPNSKISNIKKYSIPRKYPLMEKSQKILKQLKHNRRMPKPRAHLASLHDSLVSNEHKTSTVERNIKSKPKVKEKVLIGKNQNKETRNSYVERKNLKPVLTNTKTIKNVKHVLTNSKNNKNIKHVLTNTKTSKNVKHVLTNIKPSNAFHSVPEQRQPQKILEKSAENINSYLSDATTDSEYERFVQSNKLVREKEAYKSQKKNKKALKAHKNISVNRKVKSPQKSSGRVKNNSRSAPVQSILDPSDYSSSDSDDVHITSKRKKYQTQESSTIKNKKYKTNGNPKDNEYKSEKRELKSLKRKPANAEENVDAGNSLQSWSEQYDSNFYNESSNSDNEKTHKASQVLETAKDKETVSRNLDVSDNKELSNVNVEASSNNLLCCKEGRNFSPAHSYLTENQIHVESTENVASNISDVTLDSNLTSFSKHELNSKSPLSEINVSMPTHNNTLHNLTQNQLETKDNESHLEVSELPSLPAKISNNSSENVPVITLSSGESDTEVDSVSNERNNEVVRKTQDNQDMSFCSSTYENPKVKRTQYVEYVKPCAKNLLLPSPPPDIEIIEVKPCKNIPLCSTAVDDSNDLTTVDTGSLYTHDRITQIESHLSKETSVCSDADEMSGYLTKNFFNNAFGTALSKEEIKNILAQFNIGQVKEEKVSTNVHSATYSTDICKESNEKDTNIKINSFLKNSGVNHISQNLGRSNCKPIDIASSVNSVSSTSVYTVKKEKEDDSDEVIIIDSDEQKGSRTLFSVTKEKTVDDDIIIDSFVTAESKNISRVSSSDNFVQNKNISSSVNANIVSEDELHNYLVHCKDKLSTCNSSLVLKSKVKVECPGSDILPVVSPQESINFLGKVLLPQVNSSDVNVPVENPVQLLEVFKKEFKTYQEILRTEKNVQAGLKFVEAHQAEKLRFLRSKINSILKDNSAIKLDDNSMLVKEKQSNLMYNCDILNSTNATLGEFQHSLGGCSEVFLKNGTSAVQDSHVSKKSQIVSEPGISVYDSPVVKKEPDDSFVIQCLDRQIMPQTDYSQSQPPTSVYDSPAIKKEPDDKSMVRCLDKQIMPQVDILNPVCKVEGNFIDEPTDIGENSFQKSLCVKSEEKTWILLDKKCNVCGKGAVFACQRCAKVFFCSQECGIKFWTNGHEKTCGQ